jgi:DNA-binding MarR family transcriptional regulator
MTVDMQRVRREAMRWHLLRAADVCRPTGMYLEGLLPIVQAVYADATTQEVKRELDYLDERKLVKIQRDPMDRWYVELTRHGIDIVEYTTDVEPGISRPRFGGG